MVYLKMSVFDPFLYKFACRSNSMTQFQDLFAFMLDKIRKPFNGGYWNGKSSKVYESIRA